MNTVEQMRLFMEPQSIAIIGVSRKAEEGSWTVVGNLLSLGFKGKIYPVNPKAEQILGVKAYPNLQSIPGDIDLAVVATPRFVAIEGVKECVERGIKAIVVVAQGYADSDEEGKRMQRELTRIAADGGARIIGPNTFGVANAFCNLSTSFAPFSLTKSPIGMICQTGLFFPGLSRSGCGKIVDLGNTCDIDAADALEYFCDDPDIKVINVHMEGLEAGEKFLRSVKKVVTKKPIIILKTARSERGAEAAQSHTGALTGKDEVYGAVFKQHGIIRVDDVEELEDVSLAFLKIPVMKGPDVAIMSWAGSTGVMAVDACEKYGLKVATLSSEAQSRIRELSPPDWLPVGNPVDIWACIGLRGFRPQDFKNGIRTILEVLLAEEGTHAVLAVIFDYLEIFDSDIWDMSHVAGEVAEKFKDKPIAFVLMGPRGKLYTKLENLDTVAAYPSYDRAVKALAKVREYGEFLNRTLTLHK